MRKTFYVGLAHFNMHKLTFKFLDYDLPIGKFGSKISLLAEGPFQFINVSNQSQEYLSIKLEILGLHFDNKSNTPTVRYHMINDNTIQEKKTFFCGIDQTSCLWVRDTNLKSILLYYIYSYITLFAILNISSLI